MLNHSNKSKGFLPVKSGPNLSGFDMGNSNSLMGMMQTGGQATAGGAALARAVQRQGDIKRLEEAQRAEAKRQKEGGLFGSIGGLAGGLLGAALSPFTAGASLALVSGLGTALGRGVGERLGAGKSRSVDRTGTVFGQQSFRDVEEASRDFTRGIGERALASGLKAAATAGLAPGGGVYGKVGGKLATSQARQALAESIPMAIKQAPSSFASIFKGRSIPTPLEIPNVERITDLQNLAGEYGSSVGLPFSPSSSFLSQPLYNPVPQGFTGPFLASGDFLSGMQDGGLLGMQTGGFTAESILESAGLDPTSNQLKLFQAFDPTGLQNTTDTLRQQLLSATQQSTQQQVMSGFAGAGGVEQTQSAISKAAEGQFDQALAEEKARFTSQTLGTAADLVAGGAEFSNIITPSAPPPEVDSLPTSNIGMEIQFNGQLYRWSQGSQSYQLVDFDYDDFDFG